MEGGRMQRFAFVFLSLVFPLSGPALSGTLEEDLTGLVEKVRPSVVKVTSEAGAPGKEHSKSASLHTTLACGIAIDPQHVVTTADIEQIRFLTFRPSPESASLTGEPNGIIHYAVRSFDGQEQEARLVASDRISNLAVLQVDGASFTPAPFGNSNELKTGSLVVIPASCLAKTASATFGPVAELRKDGSLLLDIAILPGTVGAPVLNSKGEVVGMVTGQTGGGMAVRAFPSENNDIQKPASEPVELAVSGQAVALPSVRLQRFASQLIQDRRVARSFLGVYPQDLDSALKEYNKIDYGVLVTDLARGGPGDKAGLKSGDVILSINGQKVEGESQFRQLLSEKKPGDTLKMQVLRNGRKRNVSVTLGDRSDFEAAQTPVPPVPLWRNPAAPKSLTPAYPEGEGFLGISARDLTPREKERRKLDGGAYLEDITAGSPAEKAGLRTGDVVTAFDGKPISDADDLYRKIRAKSPGKEIPIEILRRGERQTLNVELANRSDFQEPSGMPSERNFQMFRFGEKYGFLGITAEPLAGREQDSLGVHGGVRVAEVTPDSPADKAGLKEGDIITSIDGQEISGPEGLSSIVARKKPGDRVEIDFLRQGSRRTAKAELSGKSEFERFFDRLGPSGRMDLSGPFDQRDRKIEELQKQIDELHRQLDSLRQKRE